MERKYLIMPRIARILALTAALSTAPIISIAQLTVEMDGNERVWDKAKDAYEKKQYALAMNVFEEYISASTDVIFWSGNLSYA